MSNVNSATNALKPIVENTQDALPAVKIVGSTTVKSPSFINNITEHLPQSVKDVSAKVGEKANQFIKYTSENPKTVLASGALAALTAGILIGRSMAKQEDTHHDSLEDAIIRDFLKSK